MPVAHLDVDLIMAASAQGHEVFCCMRPATGDRELVVYLFGGCHTSFSITALAVGVRLIILISNAFPFATVFLFDVRCPLVLVVLLPCQCTVLIAVGLVGQLRAAGVSAGALRFRRHGSLLLSMEDLPHLKLDDVPYLLTVRYFPIRHGASFFRVGIAKAPADCSVEARSLFSFQFT